MGLVQECHIRQADIQSGQHLVVALDRLWLLLFHVFFGSLRGGALMASTKVAPPTKRKTVTTPSVNAREGVGHCHRFVAGPELETAPRQELCIRLRPPAESGCPSRVVARVARLHRSTACRTTERCAPLSEDRLFGSCSARFGLRSQASVRATRAAKCPMDPQTWWIPPTSLLRAPKRTENV